MNMPFGKYVGMEIRMMAVYDVDYCRWILRQPWLDEGLRERITDAIQMRPSREDLMLSLEMLQRRLESATINIPFTRDEMTKLISLCHPDKHNDSPIATMMTQKLLELRSKT